MLNEIFILVAQDMNTEPQIIGAYTIFEIADRAMNSYKNEFDYVKLWKIPVIYPYKSVT